MPLFHPGDPQVIVDLSLNAYGNARAHFDSRKRHSAKQVKTLAANEQALKAAEKKAAAQLLKVGGKSDRSWRMEGVALCESEGEGERAQGPADRSVKSRSSFLHVRPFSFAWSICEVHWSPPGRVVQHLSGLSGPQGAPAINLHSVWPEYLVWCGWPAGSDLQDSFCMLLKVLEQVAIARYSGSSYHYESRYPHRPTNVEDQGLVLA